MTRLRLLQLNFSRFLRSLGLQPLSIDPRARWARSRPIVLPFILSWTTLGVSGWVRPAIPGTPKLAPNSAAPAATPLDYVIVAVAGQPRQVAAGQEITVVRGDRITLQDAALAGQTRRPRELNLVGFQGSNGSDDRAQEIDTAALPVRWSEGEQGRVFAVVATTKKELHGSVFIRLVDPVLRYAEISLNGQRRVLRGGETLTLQATDMIKVERAVTNMASHDGVLFQIAADPATKQPYEIRFLRAGQTFARIPLQIGPTHSPR